MLGIIAPSGCQNDTEFRAWWDTAGNRAASPAWPVQMSNDVTESDVRNDWRDDRADT